MLMVASIARPAPSRLERSCGVPIGDRIQAAPSASGWERVEASFAGHGFAPHRHDTYAIGVTLQGVQAFRYRGSAERSIPGHVFVLHPDETHDGRAGTAAGFRYRTLYLAPALMREALEPAGAPLPFVRDTVTRDRRLAAAVGAAFSAFDAPVPELHRDHLLVRLADALAALDRSAPRAGETRIDRRAVDRARSLLEGAGANPVGSAMLEAATGLSRYALARQFRACFGVSPHRYLVLRRLDRARALLHRGVPLAEAALACGFADQSHMSRRFKQAYGLSPGRWAALAA